MTTLNYTQKLHPGSAFPEIMATLLNGETVTLGMPQNGADWQLVVVYRGRHCPMCTRYLNALEKMKSSLADIKVDIIAVSSDSKSQLQAHLEQLNISFPIAYGLTLDQMKVLGLFISDPRSPQETDHPFAEPGVFVVNAEGKIQVVDISNNPFVRPDLMTLVNGLAWIRDPNNHYPIRGMHQ
ncbi:redoxin domain-containing protein [Gayadomonas joobiniege]|uniref:redoxin domain-containing protein n=1 Tax=Gayadomonas joobiniege TaxID=1234606 RepID=UPI0003666B8D|nr:redoxin domain-containing protein [Gayadomonas joobiniege]